MARLTLTGIPVSTGVSIGRAWFLNRTAARPLPRVEFDPSTPEGAASTEAEAARLEKAFDDAKSALARIREQAPAELVEHVSLIDSHLMILSDPKLRKSALAAVRTGKNAEWGLETAVQEIEKALGGVDDPYIRGRVQDVRQSANRVMDALTGRAEKTISLTERSVLMAHDVSPADAMELEMSKIMALVTVQGGKTSHTGILARSMQIPAVVGASAELEREVEDGCLVIVDALKGVILVDPDEEELTRYAELKYDFEAYQTQIMRWCYLPGETIDGYRVGVHANIELLEEVSAVLDYGGEGVGLYRTEYSYLSRIKLPEEEELVEEYLDLASILSPRKVVLRTLDVGADKFMGQFGRIEEDNPALGMRAIRFCLSHRELFKTQLRAILRASVVGNVSLMFPMISGMRELRMAMAALREAQAELHRQGLPFHRDMPVGVMIELPSAVMIAEMLAREVDFFSIGTNDLIQYSLGIDRTNRYVSYLYQPLHPAVLRSIKHVVDAAHQAGIEVSLCGEVASDPFCVPILMGMQVDSLSMNAQAIPGIKRIIRQASMDECKQLLKQVLESSSVARTNRLVREAIFRRFPEELNFFASMIDEG